MSEFARINLRCTTLTQAIQEDEREAARWRRMAAHPGQEMPGFCLDQAAMAKDRIARRQEELNRLVPRLMELQR